MVQISPARIPHSPLNLLLLVCLVGLNPFLAKGSMVDVTSSTTGWTPVTYVSGNSDPSNDQQTGSSEGDLVGNAAHPALYTQFGDANTPSPTDGTLAFRARLGADVNPAGFKTAVFVGIDANADGAIDLFIGVNNSGSSNTIGIWNPGNGANTSPNTTTIVSVPLISYGQIATNYNWVPVSITNDPTIGTATDIDGGGQNDHFLTFAVPFDDIVTQLSVRGINGVTENSVFRYVMATATQANSLNQDLNGVGQNYDGSLTWSQLGALADPLSVSGVPVPENASLWAVIGVALVAIVTRSRIRSKTTRVPVL
jgi:hypothetical protein